MGQTPRQLRSPVAGSRTRERRAGVGSLASAWCDTPGSTRPLRLVHSVGAGILPRGGFNRGAGHALSRCGRWRRLTACYVRPADATRCLRCPLPTLPAAYATRSATQQTAYATTLRTPPTPPGAGALQTSVHADHLAKQHGGLEIGGADQDRRHLRVGRLEAHVIALRVVVFDRSLVPDECDHDVAPIGV